MTKPVKERLALLLLKLATEYGEDRISGTRSLGLAVTHEDLARLVGASREMVSKVMRQFRDAGWVHSSRKTIEVVNLDAMSEATEARFSVLTTYQL